jgi:hypothetical protein
MGLIQSCCLLVDENKKEPKITVLFFSKLHMQTCFDFTGVIPFYVSASFMFNIDAKLMVDFLIESDLHFVLHDANQSSNKK